MKLIGKAVVLGLALAGTGLVACSSGQVAPTTGTQGQVGQNNTGSIKASLTLPGGATVSSVSWTVTNSITGFTTSGSSPAGNSSVEFVIGGLPAGGGYTISLHATDSTGDNCAGSATFSITAGAVSSAVIILACNVANDAAVAADVTTGGLYIDAGFVIVSGQPTQCPGISSFVVTPAELPVGTSSALSVATTGASAAISWTQSNAAVGSFSSTTSATPSYTCLTAGSSTVTVTVGLAGSSACTGLPYTSYSVNIICEPGTGVVDSGTPVVDSGVADTGRPDTGTPDTGVADTGTPDTGVADTGTPDTGTVSPCAVNNGGAGCTATEQLFVNKSLDCYSCLVGAGCLNDTTFGDHGNECGDVAASQPTLDGTPALQACLNTITCFLGTTPSCALNAPIDCYCGSAKGNACNTSGAANGTCENVEANGLDTVASDPVNLQKVFGDTARPAGKANGIFACGAANSCTSCVQ